MYSAIVLAAGMGSRMGLGYNKMLYAINEEPVVNYTLKKFLRDSQCSQVILVISSSEVEIMKDVVITHEKLQLVIGGSERQYSVNKGLQVVTEDVVLVHDGARPFVNQQMINDCYQLGTKGIASIVGVPMKDTIKRVQHNQVIETLNREELYSIQTPQGAPTALLKSAHEQAKAQNFLGTDEASLIEKYTDANVQIVTGSYNNIKLTTPDDLILAEQLIKKEVG